MAGNRWKVILYRTEDGKQPVQEFLYDLADRQKADAHRLSSKFKHLDNLGFDGARSCELVAKVRDTDKIWRLKVWGTDLRVCFFLWQHSSGQRCMVMASAEFHQQDELLPETIRKAVEARADWFERHG